MSDRMKLPNRRGQTVFEVEHEEQRYWIGVGQPGVGDADFTGPPSEVFVQSRRTSSTVEAIARDAAILTSFALQHGISAAELASAVTRDEQGQPSTIIGAILDALVRDFPTAPQAPGEFPIGAPPPDDEPNPPAPATVATAP